MHARFQAPIAQRPIPAHLRNQGGATAAIAYSACTRAYAPIAVPLI